MGHSYNYHKRLRLEGGKRPYVDGRRAQAHVMRLVSVGMTRRQIEHAAGVDYRTVRNALEGKRLQQASERAIMAVRPRVDSEWCYVPAAPSIAIVERLWHQGFSKSWIADQIGGTWPPKPGQRKVRAFIARRLRELEEFYQGCEGHCRDGRRLGGRDNGRRAA